VKIFTDSGALTTGMQDNIDGIIDKARILDLLFLTDDMVERRALGACISMRLEFIINDSILRHIVLAQRLEKKTP